MVCGALRQQTNGTGCLAGGAPAGADSPAGVLLGPRLLVAVALQALSGVWVCVSAMAAGWLVLPSLLGAAVGICLGDRRLAAALFVLPPAFFFYAQVRQPAPGPADLSRLVPAGGFVVRAVVADELPSSRTDRRRFKILPAELIFPRHARLTGAAIISVGGSPPAYRRGSLIEVKARVRKPERAVFPWQFDVERYLRRQGIYCLCSASANDVAVLAAAPAAAGGAAASGKAGVAVSSAGGLSDAVREARARLIATHRSYAGDREGELLASIVLGDRVVSLPPDVRADFRNTGLSHLLAASGFNLTVVTGMTWWLSRLVTRSVYLGNLACFLAMACFVGLAGPSPSVVRAAIMCSLTLISRCLFRSLHGGAALSFALLATIIADPHAVSDIGLQLSYAATAAILCGAPAAARSVRSRGRCLRWLLETAAVICLAQLAVLPLQLFYFWEISSLFLPANLLVSPVVPVVTVAGFVSSAAVLLDGGTGLAAPLAQWLDGGSSWLLKYMLWLTASLASWEWARFSLGPPALPWIVAYYVCLVAVLAAWRCRRSTALIAAAAALTLAFLLLVWRPPLPGWRLAVFPGTVVALGQDRSCIIAGRAGSQSVERFLAYFGAGKSRSAAPPDCSSGAPEIHQIPATAQHFGLFLSDKARSAAPVNSSGGALKIYEIPGTPHHFGILLADKADAPTVARSVPPCEVVIAMRDPTDNSSAGKSLAADRLLESLTEAVRLTRARQVVLDSRILPGRYRIARLTAALRARTGMSIVKMDRQEVVLAPGGALLSSREQAATLLPENR